MLKEYMRIVAVTCVTIVLATLGACSAQRYEPLEKSGATLKGTFKYKGETLQHMKIIVQSDASQSSGVTGAAGEYFVDNAPIGNVKITLSTDDMQMAASAAAAAREYDKNVALIKVPNLPSKYTTPAQTPLETTITPGENVFDITVD